MSGFELDLWLADRLPGFSVTSPRPRILRIVHGSATELTLYPATSLPTASTGISLAAPDRPVSAEMRYEEWSEHAGVQFPTRRVNFHSGVKRGQTNTENLLVNGGLSPKVLTAKPANFAPDIRR